jgi:hypothetical protein
MQIGNQIVNWPIAGCKLTFESSQYAQINSKSLFYVNQDSDIQYI